MNAIPEPTRILVAVEDTAGALRAARVAVGLARTMGAQVRFVHVLTDGELAHRFAGLHHDGTLHARRASAGASVLAHVGAIARDAGVKAQTLDFEGDPASVVLSEASAWSADLIVLGTSPRKGPGHSYLGHTARHVLEFSEVPVLVVPAAPG